MYQFDGLWEDELRNLILWQIRNIEDTNRESAASVRELDEIMIWRKNAYESVRLNFWEELNDEIFEFLREHTKVNHDFIDKAKIYLNSDEATPFESNYLYPKLIRALGELITSYTIMTDEMNYIRK